MFSIFFKCPECKAHMSAEDSDVGWEFSCPQCNNILTVPSGDIIFACGNCRKSMMAPASMVGEDFNCPECSQRVAIPRPERELTIPETPPESPPPPEPPKPVVTKLALPPELQERLAKKKAAESSDADKRLNDYLMMTWGPDVLAAATPRKKDGRG